MEYILFIMLCFLLVVVDDSKLLFQYLNIIKKFLVIIGLFVLQLLQMFRRKENVMNFGFKLCSRVKMMDYLNYIKEFKNYEIK